MPNHRIGKVGKAKKYCTLEEAKELEVKDLDLFTLWNNELSPFIVDWQHPTYVRRIRKTHEAMKKEDNTKLQDFIDSDLFDSESVGDDISDEEFLENEIFFAMNE